MKLLKSKFRLNPALRRGLFSLAVCLPSFSSATAGSVKMVPDDTIAIGTRWNLIPTCGGGNCRLTYVTDGVDGNYIWANSGISQCYSFTNTSGIPGTATIDSYVVWLRMATDNPAGNDRVLPRIRSTGTSNYCDGANMNIQTTAFADSSRRFTSWPDGAGTCGFGLLKIERMDSLQLQVNYSIGDTLKITECSVVVWYTEAGGAKKARRRHLLSDEGGYEKFAEYCGLDPNWVIGFREPEFIWREE